MTTIDYQRTSPVGFAQIDMSRVFMDVTGAFWIRDSGSGTHNDRITPADAGEIAAITDHFGGDVATAVSAMQALA